MWPCSIGKYNCGVLFFFKGSSSSPGVGQVSTPIDAFADDYAFFVRGLLDLYEVTFDCKWVEWAKQLQASTFPEVKVKEN